MKAITNIGTAVMLGLFFLSGCANAKPDGPPPWPGVIASESQTRPPFQFSEQDEALLQDVQRGAFKFFWDHVDPVTGMVPDRSSIKVISVAGVGFQLSAISIGVERGWITREQGEERAGRILRALEANPKNRKAGLFFHYLDPGDAGPSVKGYETTVSTIDSALLFAGIITASSYFGGEIAAIGDRLVSDANWAFFLSGEEEPKLYERGFISLGWKPKDKADPTGDGTLLPFYWADAGDEQRLVTFLAVAAPKAEHRVDASVYYRMRRTIGNEPGIGPVAWFPWSGALFTAFFSHCWINYAAIGADEPWEHGVANRASVDWWENSRRMALVHRARAIENPKKLPTFGENAWGLSACDAATGYIVPGVFPKPAPMPGARPEYDFPDVKGVDQYGDGTIAPYSAGSAIMFTPQESVAALRHYRGLKDSKGQPLVWRDPAGAGCGFLDSFNLGTGWVAPDYVAIDQGPLILAIENARSGKVWSWFHNHQAVKDGLSRLGLDLSE